MEFIYQPSDANRLGDHLQNNLGRPWTHFRAAVAFAKRSGTRHIKSRLAGFSQRAHAEVIVGIDHGGTSSEGLRDLLDALTPDGRVIVFHNRLPSTFHPKVYLFKSAVDADVLIGSGNLTEGGLFTNYEAGLRLSLDLRNREQAKVLHGVEEVLDGWADLSTGTARRLDDVLLAHLTAIGLTPLEGVAAGGPEGSEKKEGSPLGKLVPFAALPENRAPPILGSSLQGEAVARDSLKWPPKSSTALGHTGFLMILQRTDVGVGQTSAGTSRRSPEIFIPLSARNADPEFWGWPDGFVEDQAKVGKFDRRDVRMRLGPQPISVNMMTWPDKHDFRLRSEALRRAGRIGDILWMEMREGQADHEYYVQVIPQDSSQYPLYHSLCTERVRNSEKKYGYY